MDELGSRHDGAATDGPGRSPRPRTEARALVVGAYDYDSYSRLTGPVEEPPTTEAYRVRVRPLERAHPWQAMAGTAAVLLAQGSFLAWLLLNGLTDPRENDGLLLVVISAFTAVAIVSIELFRLVNLTALTVATAWARNPVPVRPDPGLRVAFLTTIVPGKEPVDMVRRTLEAARRVHHDGPLDVWLLDEGDDPEVRRMCAEVGARHFSRRGSERYNQPSGPFKAKTKHGNYNAWIDGHGDDYDVFVSVDPDHVPHENFCERLIGYFRDPDVAYVVAPQVYGNYDNLITRCAESQQFIFHGLIQRMGNRFGCSMLVGTNNAVRLAALRTIDGLSDSITEDIATGLSLHGAINPATGRRWRSVYTPDVVAVGEGPDNLTDFFSQQHRWSRGTFELLRGPFWRSLTSLTWGPRAHYALIASYYPSAALGWIFGALNCALYLAFGATSISLPPHWWVLVYTDLAFVQFVLAWSNRRHNISPHEAQGAAGGAGMFITMLSAPIYAAALLQTVLKRSANFVVTPKGGAASRDSLSSFRHHLRWGALLIAALVASLLVDHHQGSMRWWSLTLVASCVMPLVISVHQHGLRRSRAGQAVGAPAHNAAEAGVT
jgi:cellulose synthase/poly-beta-1,6-N-acetylglucosamine synthase-like glycosyltransferase